MTTIDHDLPRPSRPNLAERKSLGRPSELGRFLRINDVIATTGLSRSTIYRMVDAGTFPDRVRLTTQTVGWWQADVAAWIESRRHAS
jgi:prophage regulatory protein